MAASATSESLAYQAAATDSLLRRMHQGCSGLHSKHHPVTHQLFTTYPDIERKLTKSFPEHPGTIDLVKVGTFGRYILLAPVISLIPAYIQGGQAGLGGALETV